MVESFLLVQHFVIEKNVLSFNGLMNLTEHHKIMKHILFRISHLPNYARIQRGNSLYSCRQEDARNY